MATLSIADAFFLEELQAAVGDHRASTWLSSTLAKARSEHAHRGSSSSSTTPSSTPLARSLSSPQRRSNAAAALGAPSRAKISYSWSSGSAAKAPHSPADAPAASEDDQTRRSAAAAALGAPSRAKISYSWSSGRAAKKPHSPADALAASEDDERVKRVLRAGGLDAGLVYRRGPPRLRRARMIARMGRLTHCRVHGASDDNKEASLKMCRTLCTNVGARCCACAGSQRVMH